MPNPPPPTDVDKPIVVFVSSRQKEFQQLRDYLKVIIEGDDFLRRVMMRVELAERRGGERVRGDISQALKDTSIYVGIFGNIYSPKTIAEYYEARRRGLPVLIFNMIRTGTRDQRVKTFLEREVKEKDDYKATEIPFQPSKSEAAAWTISQRVANTVANLIHENVEIRRKVHPQ
mgnify:CR=1 FL=1